MWEVLHYVCLLECFPICAHLRDQNLDADPSWRHVGLEDVG